MLIRKSLYRVVIVLISPCVASKFYTIESAPYAALKSNENAHNATRKLFKGTGHFHLNIVSSNAILLRFSRTTYVLACFNNLLIATSFTSAENLLNE